MLHSRVIDATKLLQLFFFFFFFWAATILLQLPQKYWDKRPENTRSSFSYFPNCIQFLTSYSCLAPSLDLAFENDRLFSCWNAPGKLGTRKRPWRDGPPSKPRRHPSNWTWNYSRPIRFPLNLVIFTSLCMICTFVCLFLCILWILDQMFKSILWVLLLFGLQFWITFT